MIKHCAICFCGILALVSIPAAQAQADSPAAGAGAPAQARMIDRLPEHLLYLYTQPVGAAGPSLAENQLTATKRRWEDGRTLRVCLFGGNATVAKLIRDTASEWNKYGNITFDFGPEGAWYNCLAPTQGSFQIRIGFTDRGFWSAVGNDAEVRLLPLQPSMNFADFNSLYTDLRQAPGVVASVAAPYHLAVIRHEFGHALGLLHELQNPSLNCMQQIKWQGPGNVYDYLAKPPNGWSPGEVERNLGYVGAVDPDYKSEAPDIKSIMMYSMPPEIFLEGTKSDCYAAVNYAISQKDREIVAKIYPPNLRNASAGASELHPSSANLISLPRFIDPPNRRDLVARAVIDLQSPDKFIRRDARARLTEVMTRGITNDEISDLVKQMHGSPYRFQLGVAYALAQAHGAIKLGQALKDELLQLSKRTSDLTLKQNLQAAAR